MKNWFDRNKNSLLITICVICFFLILGSLKISLYNWQYWTMILLFGVYGILQYDDGKNSINSTDKCEDDNDD